MRNVAYCGASGNSAKCSFKPWLNGNLCLQVDSSCYAIPSPRNVQSWVSSVPNGFKFHFKAFGLFCAQSCITTSLPRRVRALLPPSMAQAPNVQLQALPDEALTALWDAFHAAIQPAFQVLCMPARFARWPTRLGLLTAAPTELADTQESRPGRTQCTMLDRRFA